MKTIINLTLLLLLFAGCAPKPQILLYNNSITSLVQEVNPQSINMEYFDSQYYMPWHITSMSLDKQTASWANQHFDKENKYYGENILPWKKEQIQKIINTTNFDDYNSDDRYAITIRNEQLRELPTIKPFFEQTNLPGEGYPFDYLQNSRIHINTPLFISHFSDDGSWAFVQNPFSVGWIPTGSLVVLNKKQKESFENSKKIVISRDDTPIYTKDQRYITKVKLGAIFPYVREDELFYYSYIFINTLQNFGKKIEVRILKNNAGVMPITFNAQNVLKISQQLLDKKYGWGGYLGNRDCSAMTKDFMAVFGIWLPRNSAAQKNAGQYLSLKGLTPKEKEKEILKNGIPFVSLIYLKGHIMLYIGEKDKKAMVMHDLWGIRTDDGGKEGRYVIGKTIISTLYIGKNLSDVDVNSLLINKIEGIMIKPDIMR
ncbi:MAG: SH3 domain-containing protein [Sulfurospirillaceae bacterium]|nr:SH3 domain-containing protein [Sulfurospirillaceae bacterium]